MPLRPFSGSWISPNLAPLGLLLACAAIPLAAAEAVAQSKGIAFPSPGVVCDRPAQLCYDRRGLSLELTREYFGSFAEQEARRRLESSKARRRFELSNGVACDLEARTCWDDGWNRKNVSKLTTRQLFQGSDPDQAGGQGSGECRLRRGSRLLFAGRCDLREQRDSSRQRFVVHLDNGARYSFEERRGGGYRISDGNGTSWPVQVSDRGRTAIFRWSDLSLETTQRSYGERPGTNRNLQEILEQLFH